MPIVRIFFIVYLQQSMACLILILSCQSIVFPSYSAQTFFYASTYKRVRLMEKEARSLVVVPRMASPLSATYRHNTINSSYGGAKASSPQPFSIRMDHLTPPLLLILLVVAAVFFSLPMMMMISMVAMMMLLLQSLTRLLFLSPNRAHGCHCYKMWQ